MLIISVREHENNRWKRKEKKKKVKQRKNGTNGLPKL